MIKKYSLSKKPKVSIIIASYNHEKYIEDAINSVFNQTYQDFEIVIVDDCSKDNSVKKIQKFKDKRIKLICLDRNGGQFAATNKCIEESNGQYLAILNSDDKFCSEKIEKQVKVLDDNSNIKAVFTFVSFIDEDGNVVKDKKDTWFEQPNRTRYEWLNHFFYYGNKLCHPSVLLRRECHDKLGYYKESFSQMADFDFWIKLCLNYEIFIIPEELTMFRIRANNANRSSNSSETLNRTLWEYTDILNNYLSIKTIKELFTIFPEAKDKYHHIKDKKLISFIISMLAIEANYYSTYKNAYLIFVIRTLFALLNDNKISKKIEEQTNFTYTIFFDLLSKCDITNIVKVSNLEKQIYDLEVKLLGTEQHLKDAYEDSKSNWDYSRVLESKIKQLEQQMHNIVSSKTYHFLALFKEAFHSKKKLLLLPLRISWFFVPEKIKNKTRKSVFYKKLREFLLEKRFFNLLSKNEIQINITYKKWDYSKPFISIILVANNINGLSKTLKMITNQTFKNIEIKVLFNGAIDPNITKIIEDFDDHRIKLLLRYNQRFSNCENEGIRSSYGKYIYCSHLNEEIKPTFIEKCIFILENTNYDVCYIDFFKCGYTYKMNENINNVISLLKEKKSVFKSAVFKKLIYTNVGGFDQSLDNGFEELDFWIRILKLNYLFEKINDNQLIILDNYSYVINNNQRNEIYENIVWKKHKSFFINYKKQDIRKQNIKFIIQNNNINMLQNMTTDNNYKMLIAMPYMVIGGADTVLMQISKFLIKNNFDLIFITTLKHSDKEGDTSNEFKSITKEVYDLCEFLNDHNKWKDFIYYLIETRKINLIFIIGCEYMYNLLPEIKIKYPYIKIVDQLYNEFGHIANNRKYKQYIDINFVENERVEFVLENQYLELKSKIKLIPNGVNIHEFIPYVKNTKNEYLYNKYNIPNNKFIISYFGRLSEEKSPDVFIELVKELYYNEYLFFLLCGNGPLFNIIEKKVKENKLGDKVLLLGFVNTIEFLKITNVVVVPSKLDGRPNIVLESMSMGIPVVASSVGGLPKIIKNEYNGFLNLIGDINGFKKSILSLFNDKKLYDKISKNSRQYALENLDIEIMFKKYLDILLHLIKGN